MSVKLFTNGFPKTGNHALVKACELLGVPADVNHTPFTSILEGDYTHRIMIKRDPRDVVVSMLRFKGQPVTPGTFIARFRKFEKDSLPEEMIQFSTWMDDVNTLVVAYEDLIKDPETMQKIAEYLGVPYIDGAFEELPGLTYTWNDIHSDYRKVWTPAAQKVWDQEGGRTLIEAWGYKWNS